MHHLYSTWVAGLLHPTIELETEDKPLWVQNQSYVFKQSFLGFRAVSSTSNVLCSWLRCMKFDAHLTYLNAHTKLLVC